MEDEVLVLCVDPVYFGRAESVLWLVCVTLTGDFPFREDLEFQARKFKSYFTHSMHHGVLPFNKTTVLTSLWGLGHLAAAVWNWFLDLWSEVLLDYKYFFIDIFVFPPVFFFFLICQPWRTCEVICPYLQELGG